MLFFWCSGRLTCWTRLMRLSSVSAMYRVPRWDRAMALAASRVARTAARLTRWWSMPGTWQWMGRPATMRTWRLSDTLGGGGGRRSRGGPFFLLIVWYGSGSGGRAGCLGRLEGCWFDPRLLSLRIRCLPNPHCSRRALAWLTPPSVYESVNVGH